MHRVTMTIHPADNTELEIQTLLKQAHNQAMQTIGAAVVETALDAQEPIVVQVTQTSQVGDGDIKLIFDVTVEEEKPHPYAVGWKDAPSTDHALDFVDDDQQGLEYWDGWVQGMRDLHDGLDAPEMTDCTSPIYRTICGIPNKEEAYLDGRQDRAGGINLLGNPFRWDSECKEEVAAAKAWSQGWHDEHLAQEDNNMRAARLKLN